MSDQPGTRTSSTRSSTPQQHTGEDPDTVDRYDGRDDAEAAETAEPAQEDDGLALEAPEADTAEQHTEVRQQRDEPSARPADQAGEADPVDAAEQRRTVTLDEDDYR
ncbi:hypothetical protein SAMN05216223_102197 [Actinacidiphila yanglinensis]|uniref:Uncharacterized protein n=1 Tax=Actinacidiphila yanglinensis TaxID=310779 RepID=A0A1H5VA44_9ACTN|nr:hypothetical protein [Actinacidiphila yanglinensis]SEF83641.1 hypothetical protein SAMN05216223_102197 [Actinacidiphila yanglinensis]